MKGVEKAMIRFIKIQSENMKMTWNISLHLGFLIFINVMTLRFCEYLSNGIEFIVPFLQPWFDTKITLEKIAVFMTSHFI